MRTEKAHEAIASLPMRDRLIELIAAIVERNPNAVDAVAAIVCMAAIMAGHLPAHERLAIAWLMQETAAELDVTLQ